MNAQAKLLKAVGNEYALRMKAEQKCKDLTKALVEAQISFNLIETAARDLNYHFIKTESLRQFREIKRVIAIIERKP